MQEISSKTLRIDNRDLSVYQNSIYMKSLRKSISSSTKTKKKQNKRNTSYNYIGNEAESINTHTLIRKQGIFI